MTTRPQTPVGRAVSAPAMSVLTFRAQTGREAQLQAWEAELERIVSTFSGYLGTEVLTSACGHDNRSVVHRFGSTSQLETWLGSDVRDALLGRARLLMAEPPNQQILVGAADHDTVTVVRSHHPAEGQERALVAWHQRTVTAQRAFPGFRGSELLRPVPGQQEGWTIVFRFSSALHLEHWLDSAEGRRLAAESPCEAHAGRPEPGRWTPLRSGRRGRRRGDAGAALR